MAPVRELEHPQHCVEHDARTGVSKLIVGPLPEGVISDQVVVEISNTKRLEVSLEGWDLSTISYDLPKDTKDDDLQVKFSKKKRRLIISWSSKSPTAAPEVTEMCGLSLGNGNSEQQPPQTLKLTQDEFPAALSVDGDKELRPGATYESAVSDTVGTAGAEVEAEAGLQPSYQISEPCAQHQQKQQKQQKGNNKKKNKGKNKRSKGQHGATLEGAMAGLEDLEGTADSLAQQLLAKGIAYVDNFLGPEVVQQILNETAPLHDYFEPGEIWVGKEAQAGAQVARDDVRGDSILWMNFSTMISNNCHTLHRAMRRMDTLVMNLLPRRVPRLSHVSEHSDAMLSIYPPPGSRFQKHIDNTARDGRCLTVLLYLNPGWTVELGGELRLWPLKTGDVRGSLITTAAQTLSRGGGVDPVDLLPVAGRLAMFYSDRVLHEVRPTRELRYAVTQWYYDRNERAEAVAAAQNTNALEKSANRKKSSTPGVDAQAEAHSFIRALMVDTSEPTPALVQALITQVESLSPEALTVASQIMGASTSSDLVKAVKEFTPQSLSDLRDELTRMGQ